ncbi:MAG: ring-1,2-phenylacetyl-CoA epoxidase subunit PaaE [Paracoccaceae bacterium]|jgi:ring-1,2-phenylacetyl-CoA epoxidase subunit PaaE
MPRFHNLTVTDIHKTTRDAVVLTLKPENGDAREFDFTQGQYLTFRRDFDGQELRRSYSICAGKDDGVLQVGIKRVEGGAFSGWANDDLKPGDTVQAMPPMGRFFTKLNATATKHYLGFAAGSGITPILSILKSTLAGEAHAEFTLIYANRGVTSIMFREELEDLKNKYLGRLTIIHILKSDAQEIDLFTGRLTPEKCEQLFKHWIDIKSVDTAFICGPEAMMQGISQSLQDHGLDESMIKYELFASGQPGLAKRKTTNQNAGQMQATTTAHVTLEGTTRILQMPKVGQSVLEAALAADLDAPFACQAGICSTCRAKVLEGEVEMIANHALEDYEVEQGYVLTCQCYPVSEKIVVDYDQ